MNVSTASGLPLILLGAGGHAKVMHALVEAAGYSVIGICDPQLASEGVLRWRGIPVLGGDEVLGCIKPATVGLINGLGQLIGSRIRERIFMQMRQAGFSFPVLVHPTAWVAGDVRLAEGVQVMAGAVIQPDCEIGANSIVNTCASIDHDCRIGSNVHIAPGATLCGGVQVEDGAFIGAGAVLIQGLRVGGAAVVGAGVTLTRELSAEQILLGAASRFKPQRT